MVREYETTLVVQYMGRRITDNQIVKDGLSSAVDFFSLVLHKPKPGCPQKFRELIASLGAFDIAQGKMLEPKTGELLLILGHPSAASSNPQAPRAKPLRLDWGRETDHKVPERILYDMNTLGGNSGSPVIARGEPDQSYKVKGIHVAGFGEEKLNRAQCLSSVVRVIKPIIQAKVNKIQFLRKLLKKNCLTCDT